MYNNILKLQTGAYIPGLSSSLFSAGLARDIAKTQADIRSQARDIKRKQRSGSLFGKLGSMLGKAGVNLFTKGLMASNPLLAMGLKAAGTGLGSYLGSRLGYGKDVGVTKNSELLGSQFKDLSQFQEGIGKERAGSAVASGLQTFAEDLKSEYGQKLMDSLRAKRIDPTEQLGGNPNLGLNVLPTRKGSVEEGMFPTFEEATGKQNNNPFKMNMRNTELDYVSPKYPPPLVMGALSDKAPADVKFEGIEGIKSVEMPTMPKGTLLGRAKGIYNRETEFLRQLKELGPARMYGIGGDKFARETYRKGLLDNAKELLGDPIDPFSDFPEEETPSVQNALLGLSNTVSQYNTPGMAHGGYVPEKGFGGLIQYRKGY